MWGTGHSTPGTPQHPQTLPPTHAQEAAWPPAGADTVDAGGAVQSGGWRPPCPLPTRGGPSVGPDASRPQPTPRPAVLSDGCGWETPCRGGAAPSTQRWRQAGDEDVTRHPSAGTVLRHRCDGGVGREANTVLLAPGWDPHGPQAPAPHYPIAHTAGTRPPAPHGLQPCLRMRPHAGDVAVPPSWAGAELSQAGVSSTHIRSQCPEPQLSTPPASRVQQPASPSQHCCSAPTTALSPSPSSSTSSPRCLPNTCIATGPPWFLPQHWNSVFHTDLCTFRSGISSPDTAQLSPPSSGVHKARASALCMDELSPAVPRWVSRPASCPHKPPHHISHPAEPPPHSPFQGSPHFAPHRAPTPHPAPHSLQQLPLRWDRVGTRHRQTGEGTSHGVQLETGAR